MSRPEARGADGGGPGPYRLGHRPALDGLRGVAILMVLAVHSQWLGGGFLGVDVFFTLSGFLITTLLLEEFGRSGSIRYGHFYMRRALRLFPALLALVAGVVLFDRFVRDYDGHAMWKNAAIALAYLSNWVVAADPTGERLGALTVTWSLSVEEQFYLLWPPALGLLLWRGVGPRALLAITVSGAIAAAAWRVWLSRHGVDFFRLYCGLDTRADSILLGCAVAALARVVGDRPRPRAGAIARLLAPMAIAAIFALSWEIRFDNRLRTHAGISLAALMTAVLIWSSVFAPSRLVDPVLRSPFLVWWGKVSYSIYLWHGPVFAYHWRQYPGLSTWSCLGLSMALACASYYGLERPFLRLKGRFAPG